MPNSLDANGLQLKSQTELLTDLVANLKSIYGANIDVSSSSSDGQAINIYVQGTVDIEDIIAQAFASFDPDQAIGTILWQRVGINGLQVQGATYTTTPVSITTDKALNLYGLDQNTNPVYYVTDAAGNQWQLVATQSIGGAGTYSFQFQAANPGAIPTIPNTITTAGLIVLGVTAINNPSLYTSLGQNEESDVALRIRRQKSVSIPSQGYQPGTEAALANISGVTYARVWENYGQSNPPTGVSINTMWAVVGGTGLPASIAQAIYVNRSTGCNMKGTQTYPITQRDGSAFVVQWDNVVSQNLFIRFTATSIDGINAPNISAILTQLPALFVPGIGAEVNINQLATYVQQIDPNTLVTAAGFSTTSGGSYTNTLTPTALNNQFVVSATNTNITPIVMLPSSVSVPHTQTQQFNAYGGIQPYVYSVVGGGSGGTINSSTGLYTAPSGTGADTVRVTDANAATANSTVTIT
jgi:hypothetical protein